jgi:putative ABC transport system permease protein
MAWRDSRGSRRRLALYLASMTVGVAALVAINSFGENLGRAVDEQAEGLLGADLVVERGDRFTPAMEGMLDSLQALGSDLARVTEFASMAYVPRADGTRLATVKGVDDGFPFFGEIESVPADAAERLHEADGALVDGAFLTQFGIGVGDSVRIGRRGYVVLGEFVSAPGETALAGLVSPRIYVPRATLDTLLTSQGSRVEYAAYVDLPASVDPEALAEELRPLREAERFGVDTVQELREDWNQGLTNLYRFLGLVGFMALILGGLGVAGSVHVYVTQRLETVAVLRCLGASSWRTFRVYLVQALALGLAGAAAGALLGVGIQLALPRLAGDLLPVDVDFSIVPGPVLVGMGIGVGVTVLFALLPLIRVRRVTPLLALRASVEATPGRDPLRLVVYAILAAGLLGFAIVQAPTVWLGVGYAVGVAVVFALLALVAKGLMLGVRRFFPSGWPYVWRQGLAGLYRPGNQTLLLMLALGLGTFLILTLALVERTLTSQLDLVSGEGGPNLVFFDVQPDQRGTLEAEIAAADVSILDATPIVTMRLREIGGRTVSELRADSTAQIPRWALGREYRSSYRSALSDAERVVEGEYVGQWERGSGLVPVSLEADIASDLGVGLGDTLVWDVQGREVPSTVGSIRRVDWQRFQTNFFVLFPEGVLEAAPQTFVYLARTQDAAESAASEGQPSAAAQVQAAVVRALPNVSAIDLGLVRDTFSTIFGQIEAVIRFMALFTILTALVVLSGAVVLSRVQRTSESVLLKTLGASRRQVLAVSLAEYLFLGLLAALTGVLLAVAASWALAAFVFDAPFVWPVGVLAATFVGVTLLTLGVGLLTIRGVYERPPLEVLRAEA